MKISCLLLGMLIPLFTYSQTSPSLNAGINEINYTKGKLDADLIAQIIASKRGEIKTELAKRLILKNFECGSFAVYNYLNSNVNLLLSETNKEIISQGLLKNSAELMMVYAFAESYLAELSKRREPLADFERAFIEEMVLWSDLDESNQNKMAETFGISACGKQSQNSNDTVIPKVRSNLVRSNAAPLGHVPDVKILNLFSNRANDFSEDKNSCGGIASVHIYVDMVFEVLRRNERVLEMGFFRKVDEVMNAEHNKFLTVKSSNYKQRIYNHICGFKERRADMENGSIWRALNDRITSVLSFYRTLSSTELARSKTTWTTDELIKAIDKAIVGFQYDTTSNEPGEVTTKKFRDFLINSLYLQLEWVNIKPLLGSNKPILSEGDEKLLVDLNEMADNLWTADFTNDVELLEFYRLKMETTLRRPLTVLNIKTSNAFFPALKTWDTLCFYIRARGLIAIKKQLLTSNYPDDTPDYHKATEVKNFFNHFQIYIQIVDLINNLDRVNSYDEIFRFLTSINDTFGDQESRNVIGRVTKSFDRYITLDRSQNKLSIDVESMAVDLYDRFGENNTSWVSMYFSVGITNSKSITGDQIIIAKDSAKGQFSYVGEKIGLKIVPPFMNFNRNYSLGNTARKPLVNGFHILAYASGILYQIEALSTNDKFKSPIWGVGGGVTFFNGLDLNISVAQTFENPYYNLLNVSFDVRIMEYFSGLKKKRSVTQN